MFSIKFTDDALADVKILPKNVRNSLKRVLLKRVAVDPYGSSLELSEPLQGWRSFHWGKYRVVFKIFDEVATIAIAGVGERLPQSRSDVYRRLEGLAAQGRLAESVLRILRGFSSE